MMNNILSVNNHIYAIVDREITNSRCILCGTVSNTNSMIPGFRHLLSKIDTGYFGYIAPCCSSCNYLVQNYNLSYNRVPTYRNCLRLIREELNLSLKVSGPLQSLSGRLKIVNLNIANPLIPFIFSKPDSYLAEIELKYIHRLINLGYSHRKVRKLMGMTEQTLNRIICTKMK